MTASPFYTAAVTTLPEGITPDLIHIIECPVATIEMVDTLPAGHPARLAGLCEASPPMVNDQQKPTIMQISAWMAHEGVNRNRQGFVRADLEELAPTLFREPNFGVMDFNHSAFRPFSEEPKVIGLWYNAEFRFDEDAQRWGILASGVMFSWLFPEHADKLLADQERLGHMRFSMACIPASVELGKDAEGNFELLHKPVFFTVSALDVKPADADAVGTGSESTEETAETLRTRLLAVAAAHPWQPQPAASKGDSMADSQELIELVEAKTRLEADVAQRDTTITELTASLDASTTAAEELAVKVTELESVVATLNATIDEQKESIAALAAERDELQSFKQESEAKEADLAKAEVLAARLDTLPAKFVESLEAKPEERRNALKAKIANMSDDEFALYRDDELGFGEVELSFLERSRREGLLDTAGDSEKSSDIAGKLRRLLNR